MPGGRTVLDAAHDVIGAGDTARDRDFHVHAGNVVGGFLKPGGAAHLMKFHRLVVLPGEPIVSRTERGLHHAAGRAEDDGGTGILTQRRVEFLIRQGGELEPRAVDHPGEFPRGDGNVDIRDACGILIVAAAFELLAVQGMTETLTMSFGSIPIFCA